MKARLHSTPSRLATCLALPTLLLAKHALALAATPAFAAPTAAVQSSGSGGIGRMVLSLLVVLALLLGGAWLLKRMGGLAGGNTQRLRVLASISLGSRERAVLIEVDGREVLLGVAPGQVRRLLRVDTLRTDLSTNTVTEAGATMAGVAAADGVSAAPGLKSAFSEILRRSLGR